MCTPGNTKRCGSSRSEENALGAQDVRTLDLHQVLGMKGKNLVRIERLVGRERDRLHLFVVIVRQGRARDRGHDHGSW
jgi:hypothetical protein